MLNFILHFLRTLNNFNIVFHQQILEHHATSDFEFTSISRSFEILEIIVDYANFRIQNGPSKFQRIRGVILSTYGHFMPHSEIGAELYPELFSTMCN